VTAAPVSEERGIIRLLVEQVTGRVRWRESMQVAWDLGVTDFVETGGKVVAPMVKRTIADAATASLVSMDDIEALLKAM
jgi:[acyl-carrier-protein] S-malonyltransferase